MARGSENTFRETMRKNTAKRIRGEIEVTLRLHARACQVVRQRLTTTRSSFGAEGDYGVDGEGAAGWQVAGEQGYSEE